MARFAAQGGHLRRQAGRAGLPKTRVGLPGVRGTNPSRNQSVQHAHGGRIPQPRRCYRSLEDLRKNNATGDGDFLYKGDRLELRKYAAALNDPRNKEMRGVETVTDNQDAVQYWRIMMAAYGVKGHARYVP
nr:restriction endonuclease fold toxin-2 domain-containing protein [Streptomyces sp. HUAS 14-6]